MTGPVDAKVIFPFVTSPLRYSWFLGMMQRYVECDASGLNTTETLG